MQKAYVIVIPFKRNDCINQMFKRFRTCNCAVLRNVRRHHKNAVSFLYPAHKLICAVFKLVHSAGNNSGFGRIHRLDRVYYCKNRIKRIKCIKNILKAHSAKNFYSV